jgi:GTP-binding protein
MVIADLPGYGFARMSQSNKLNIEDFMLKYLTKRRELSLLIMLVDSRLDAQDIDLEAIEHFKARNIPLLVVATKVCVCVCVCVCCSS